MTGRLSGIYRHPVKGLTPEPLNAADLVAGACFPGDRQWAVEVGPSGFDPAAPKHISKMRFTVLARFPALARLKTSLDDASGEFRVATPEGEILSARLEDETGREALARYLAIFLGEDAPAPLKVVFGEGHRFMDHPLGHVSLINLASVRALGETAGREIDPLRFRANLYVDGLDPWAEDALTFGARVGVGAATLSVIKPIERCIATHADPHSGERDIDVLELLRSAFGRLTLGLYLQVADGGRIMTGDAVTLPR